MANVKISDLTGAAAATSGQEFEVNDALTSKKVTASQVSSFVLSNLSSADLVTLGVTATAAELNKLDGVVGDAVGTTDTQTLTAKTLTNVVLDGSVTEEVFAVTGTTPALDPVNGTIQTWTLSAASTPTDSFAAGESMTLMIDDGTAYTITWPTMTWVNNAAAAPTLATTGYTVVALWKVSTTLYGALVGAGA